MPLVRPVLVALFALVTAEPDAPFRIAKTLYSDNFTHGLGRWRAELEKPGQVVANNGLLQLDVPAGATVWFRPELHEPVMIEYEATLVSRGPPLIRISRFKRHVSTTAGSAPGPPPPLRQPHAGPLHARVLFRPSSPASHEGQSAKRAGAVLRATG